MPDAALELGWPSRTPIRELDLEAIEARLAEVRRRTLELVAPVPEERLARQHVPILSPMIWDLGHIANFEELWLCREVGGMPPLETEYERLYDAVANPRPTREALPLPEGEALRDYLEVVRKRALRVLARQRGGERRLTRRGFVYEMVAEHEEQHQETLLQLLQLLDDPPHVPAARRALPDPHPVERDMVRVPAGAFEMGASGDTFLYDNEKEGHAVDLPEIWIDRTPVTCGDYVAFLEDGGYRKPELWSDGGRAWLAEAGAEAPGGWQRNGSGWTVRSLDRRVPLPDDRPVVHVCFWEAEAFARWRGARLPTEAEWEKAARWDPATGATRSWPWGEAEPGPEHANLDQLAFQPATVGSYPAGVSPVGAHQMVGDVWEWTASDFTAYPGFRAYPYAEYSEIFFGDEHKVLRGGSWATRPAVARTTFRNWDYPIRRQVFAGFRCARDA